MSAVYASTVADTLAIGGTEAMASAGIGNNFSTTRRQGSMLTLLLRTRVVQITVQ